MKRGQRKKKGIYDIIQTRLHDLGYPVRTTESIRNKLNALKAAYKKIQDTVGKSGAGAGVTRDFPWFFKVHEILKTRPAINAPPGSIGESGSAALDVEGKLKYFKYMNIVCAVIFLWVSRL